MGAIKEKSLHWSLRCYRALLHVYPRAFREEFEEHLCQTFGDLSRRAVEAGGYWSLFAVWLRTLLDLFSSGLDQHFGNNSDRWFRLRWIAACAFGMALGALLIFVDVFTARVVGKVLRSYLPWGRSSHDPIAIATVIVCVLSIPLGWLQSRVFGWKRVWRFAWTVATVLGISSGWAVGLLFFFGPYLWTNIVAYRALTVGFLVCGSIIGLCQMGVLYCKTSRAWAWVPACAVAMVAVGLSAGIIEAIFREFTHRATIFRTMAAEISFDIIGVMTIGAVFGLLTASPLEWIMRARRLGESSSARVTGRSR
jgi:hypothetical protein